MQENYHVELANIIQQLNQHYWIVTYDNVNKIKQLYKNCDGWKYGIRYSANKKRKESELIYKSPITRLESYERVFLEKI